MELLPLYDARVSSLLCYPRGDKVCLTERIYFLESLGVEGVYNCGLTSLWTLAGPIRVLGKGHAAVVVKVKYNNLTVALKIRRTDSKRASLAKEGIYQLEASKAGVAPKVYHYSNNFIVSELIEGPTLLDIVREDLLDLRLIKEILEALSVLDKIFILHEEISRPLKNVLFTDLKALIVDYESAKRGCGNLTKFLSWLLNYLGISYRQLVESIKLYKQNCIDNSDLLKEAVETFIEELLIKRSF